MLENSSDDYYGMNSWEKSLYPNDFLNPTEEVPCLLTKMSMSLAIASGWYTISSLSSNSYQYNYVGKMTNLVTSTFGSKKCLEASMYGQCSTDGQTSCSPDGKYKVVCKKDQFSGDCFYQGGTDYCFIDDLQSARKDFEYYGPDSRCVMMQDGTAAASPACVKVTSATTTAFTVKSKDQSLSWQCATNTGTATVVGTTTFRMDCASAPIQKIIESWTSRCTDDCNGKGICLNDGSETGSGSCNCFFGWSGNSCGIASSIDPIPVNPFINGLVRIDSANIFSIGLVILGLEPLRLGL